MAPSYTTKASIPDLIEIQFNWLNTDQNSIYRELYIGNLYWQIPFVICELSHFSKSTIMANGLKIEWWKWLEEKETFKAFFQGIKSKRGDCVFFVGKSCNIVESLYNVQTCKIDWPNLTHLTYLIKIGFPWYTCWVAMKYITVYEIGQWLISNLWWVTDQFLMFCKY